MTLARAVSIGSSRMDLPSALHAPVQSLRSERSCLAARRDAPITDELPPRSGPSIVAGAIVLGTLLLAPSAGAAQVVVAELAPIAEQVRRGETVAALASLRALDAAVRSAPATRYLVGRLAERAGEMDVAIEALEGAVAPLPQALVRDAVGRRARALARRGRCAEAEVLLAGADPLDSEERALRAECALARGALAEAETLLSAAAEEDARDVDSFALRMMLAETQVRAGARDRAIETLRALLIDRPEHPDAERAEATLETLAGAPLRLTIEERIDRAERLTSSLLHDRAAEELEGIARPRDRALARRLLHTRGMALFRSRHAYAEAAVVLARSAAIPSETSDADAFHAARALSRAGNDAGAIRAYRRLVRRAPESSEAAEAEYLAAWLEMRLGRRSARRSMERFVEGPRAARAPSMAREGRWQLALDAFRRGRHRQAAQLFAAYAREDSDPLVRGRGTYWRGRALAEAGDRAGAIEAYRAALHVSPLHWYALLARERLVALGEEPGSPFAYEARDATETPSPITLPADVVALFAMGLDRDARARVRARERELRAGADLRTMVQEYARIGDHERAYRMTARNDELTRPALRGEVWAWTAAYPRAFESAVTAAARGQSLEPELLWAIMRQESAYDPEAVSYADAIGLLQLLPSTAAVIARGLGITFQREMLFDPVWNTRLAAAYVHRLSEAHGVPLAFAAFNAGGHRVTEWLERSGEIDLDLFVEEIPFDQTRGYIRRVTSHLARYLYLRDPSAGWPAIDLPERVAPE